MTPIRRLAALAAATLAAGLLAVPATAGAADAPVPGAYVPLTPHRLVDTRVQHDAPVGHGLLGVRVEGVDGIPDSGVSAVALTVTVPSPHANGHLTVYAGDTTRPATSNLNFVAGRTVAAGVLSRVGANGTVLVYNGAAGVTDVVVDVSGYYTGGTVADPGGFVPTAPARLLDTRTKHGGSEPAGHGKVVLTVRGAGGVPAGAGAVALTVTATGATAGGPVSIGPDDGLGQPRTSTLNLVPGVSVANLAVSALPSDGKVVLYNGSAKPVHLIADVTGYFLAGQAHAPGTLTAAEPQRVLDTRTDAALGHPEPAARGTVRLTVAGRDSVPPTGVSAVLLNVTVTAPQKSGYLTVYPGGSARPTASNLNFGAGRTVADLVVAPVGPDGTVDLYNGSAGRTQVIADVEGYWSALPDPWTTSQPALPSGQQSQGITGVSCLSATTCAAVGVWERQPPLTVGPLLETLADGTWTRVEQDSPAGDVERKPTAVSCAAAGACVAVGYDDFDDPEPGHPDRLPVVDVLHDGTWTAAELTAPPGSSTPVLAELDAVSCTAATSCVAVGFAQGDSAPQMLVETWDGSSWTGSLLAPGAADATEGLTGVSCAAADSCVAVGHTGTGGQDAGAIETWDGTAWTRDTSLDPATAARSGGWDAVSCPAAGSCVAVSQGGTAATSADGSWTGATLPDGMTSVSCAAVGVCTAAGAYFADPAGDSQPWVADLRDGTWTPFGLPRPVGRGRFDAVSCAADGSCLAGGNAVVFAPTQVRTPPLLAARPAP